MEEFVVSFAEEKSIAFSLFIAETRKRWSVKRRRVRSKAAIESFPDVVVVDEQLGFTEKEDGVR